MHIAALPLEEKKKDPPRIGTRKSHVDIYDGGDIRHSPPLQPRNMGFDVTLIFQRPSGLNIICRMQRVASTVELRLPAWNYLIGAMA
jgi:hypothetical protein